MKKLAIFVEGQTEQIFLSKLLVEIAGKNNIQIIREAPQKSKSGKRHFTQIEGVSRASECRYYVLIRDCRGDESVKSDILDSYEALSRQGYEKIIGLRDVYPISQSEMPKLIKYINYGIPTKGIPIRLLLSIMEIEAWFIAENTHFEKLHPSLTKDRIEAEIGGRISPSNVEALPEPAKTLHAIYGLEGFAYRKDKTRVERTVGLLDYAKLYLQIPGEVKSLNAFIDEINSFL